MVILLTSYLVLAREITDKRDSEKRKELWERGRADRKIRACSAESEQGYKWLLVKKRRKV